MVTQNKITKILLTSFPFYFVFQCCLTEYTSMAFIAFAFFAIFGASLFVLTGPVSRVLVSVTVEPCMLTQWALVPAVPSPRICMVAVTHR